MNNLEQEMHRIIDMVIQCCVTTIADGSLSIGKEDVLGKSKKENATIARNMVAYYLNKDGFSVTTIALLMARSNQAVRNMITQHDDWCETSNAYRIANAEVKDKFLQSKV